LEDRTLKGLLNAKALITGGTSGIGQAIAVRFAAEGAHVAINFRRRERDAAETDALVHQALAQCVREVEAHGVNHILVQADIAKEDEIKHMVQEVVDGLGGLDILINNAGVQTAADSHEMSVADFDRVLAVNLRGAFLAAQAAIRHFLGEEKPGVIINVSSVHQVIPKPRFLSYSVSKGGVQNLTRTLALEYASRGIRVNGIRPGATVTPINRTWVDDPEKAKDVLKHIPVARAGTAEEMAAVTAFLASDDAAYITVQTLFVDGGLTLYPDFRTAWSSE
jgi:glucose 1-dehydrogenase